jgi:penicillin-binding protein 1C
VNAECAAVGSMTHQPWFVLPPTLEYYYRAQHGDYRPLPAWRAGCSEQADQNARGEMEFLYPDAGGRLYVPVELDGKRGRAVLEAMHRNPRAALYWHIDEDYAGRTELRHQLAIDLPPGRHQVTIVDGEGRRLSRVFEVMPQVR